jgi:hypothetical protein
VSPANDRVKYGAIRECEYLRSVNAPQDKKGSYCCYANPAAGFLAWHGCDTGADPPFCLLMM